MRDGVAKKIFEVSKFRRCAIWAPTLCDEALGLDHSVKNEWFIINILAYDILMS